jgi:hypothetical protein
MASYVNPIEPMSQLNLDIGKPSAQNQQKMKAVDPEAGSKFKEKYLSEIEANRVLREMKRDQAIDKAREFVKEGKSAFEPKSGGGSGGGGMPKSNRDITKNYKKGGKVSSASSRADGCATKGKTKGRFI